eukprot:4487036-Pleurochrysis_carterae.AAC.1
MLATRSNDMARNRRAELWLADRAACNATRQFWAEHCGSTPDAQAMLVRRVRIRAVVRVRLAVEVGGLRFIPLRLAIAISQGQQLLHHQPRELVAGIAYAHEVIDGKLLESFIRPGRT